MEALPFGAVATLTLLQLLDLFVVASDLLEALNALDHGVFTALIEELVEIVDLEELAKRAPEASPLEEGVHLENLLENRRVAAQRPIGHPLRLFDLTRDGYLTLAIEKWHRAHLAQVHAYRIAGALFGQSRRGGFFLGLVELDDDVVLFLSLVADRTIDHPEAELNEALVDLLEIIVDGDQLRRLGAPGTSSKSK